MWNRGEGKADARILQIGSMELTRLTGVSASQLRRNLASLVSKLSIECVAGPAFTAARTWKVFSTVSILERRAKPV